MKLIPDSLTPFQAWQLLSSIPRMPIESKQLSHALDHLLADEVVVPEDVPSGHRSFMDGFAVHSEDVKEVPVQLRVAGEILMGEWRENVLQRGEAMIVPTGGFLPDGCDAVVMQEDTEQFEGHVVIKRSVSAWENVQMRGEDFKRGDAILAARHRLRPQDLSVLGTFGFKQVQAYSKPRVSIVSTGNELVPVEINECPPGKIWETNSLALKSACSIFHFPAETAGIVVDEFQPQRDALEQAMEKADVILVSGGSSVGARDYTLEVIRSFADHRVHFHGLAIRPGNPTILATVKSKVIFGLPGQPVSSLIVFYAFVLPLLFHQAGEEIQYVQFLHQKFRSIEARLAHAIKPLKTKTDYVRVRVSRLQETTASAVSGKSASLSTLALADGFVVVPPGEEELPARLKVTVFLFP